MQSQLEIQFELEPIMPDTSASIKSYFDAALTDAMTKSALQKFLASEPRVTFEQHLPPTKEEVEIATIVLAFVLKEAPNIWQYTKTFLDFLVARLSKKAPTTVSFKLQIGDKKVEATGLSPDDAIKVITKKYEMEMRPRRRR
jgi:hypothetical protein